MLDNINQDVGADSQEVTVAEDQGLLTQVGRTRVSRRIFIKGVIASGAAVSAAGYMFRGPGIKRARAAVGAVERLISLNVNGQVRRVDVLPQETLAFTLRYKLGLTGTKLGCDRAECGACTVLLDDVNHYSCSTLTHSVRVRAITIVMFFKVNRTSNVPSSRVDSSAAEISTR